jgi:LEA14-like dessication related protein
LKPLSKNGVVKAVVWLLSLAVVVAPVVYALNKYEWNIQALVTPSYSPPKVDFHMEPSRVKFESGQLFAAFKLTNLGEVEVVFESLNATAYGPDGKALAPATLDKAVALPPNSTQTLTLKVSLDEATLNRLISYFTEGRDRINVEVEGEASIRVFGSKVAAPISASFEISLADIGR